MEAFLDIQRAWTRLGYPFENVVPSYGTAVGSSGDRPGALAELVGILVNDGVRLPVVQVSEVEFGVGTPYETHLEYHAPEPEQLLSREVARVAREALLDVVANGTAQFVRGVIRDESDAILPVGGKTGTGNNQFKVFGAGGRLVDARTINRTATFAFFIGDRWFGVVTAHVAGAEAANYTFTSALPLRVFALVAPALHSVLEAPRLLEGMGSE
jgi:membrane peptidoglycan carboxypeptidase